MDGHLVFHKKRLIRKSFGEWVFDGFNTILMFCVIFVTLYPFIFVLFSSISQPSRLLTFDGLLLFPRGFQLDSYRMVFMNPMITVGYLNTLFYVVAGTLINLFLTTLGAYALSRNHLYFKKSISLFIIFTMFFSGGLIPLYLQVQAYGLIDSRLSLLLPGAISAFNLIIMRTGFESVPASLEESARLDGANDWQICFRIVFPLSLPVVAVITLYYAVYHWNAWYHAMLFLKTRDLYPLQLILREILVSNQTEAMVGSAESGSKEALGEAIKYAAIIVSILPVVCLYPFLQRYFIKGIMIGAVKE